MAMKLHCPECKTTYEARELSDLTQCPTCGAPPVTAPEPAKPKSKSPKAESTKPRSEPPKPKPGPAKGSWLANLVAATPLIFPLGMAVYFMVGPDQQASFTSPGWIWCIVCVVISV